MCAHSICSKNNRTFMKVMTKLLLNVFLLVFINIVSEALSIRIQYTYPQCVDDCKKKPCPKIKISVFIERKSIRYTDFQSHYLFRLCQVRLFPKQRVFRRKKNASTFASQCRRHRVVYCILCNNKMRYGTRIYT